jgi:hypothetical protein
VNSEIWVGTVERCFFGLSNYLDLF